MINLHLNGDIVRCPDIKAIHWRIAEKREKERICKYGIHEDKCQVWQQSVENWMTIKKTDGCGRCQLSGSILCPGHRERKNTGNKEKNFKIDNPTYRKIASAGHYLIKTTPYKTIFLTLTFPKFKRDYDEKELNQCFSRFIENLRKNYNCTGYIAVREYSNRCTHRPHYHLLCSIPFTPFVNLNNAWISAISDLCYYSKRAVTSRRKKVFLRNPQRALKYICKYISKSKGQSSKTRIVFISNNLIKKPVQLDYERTGFRTIADFFHDWNSLTVHQTDYTTMLRFNDDQEFKEFCERILYPSFNLDDKSVNFYAFPTVKPSG